MENKKIVIILGSPRKKGNSATLAKQAVAGAEAEGAEVESFYLQGMNIQCCTACDKCLEEESKYCIFDDDMQALYPKLRDADALIIAGPIYWFTVSAQTKIFMDRLYAMQSPDGKFELAGKQIGILFAYEGSDPFNSGADNAIRTFQDMFNYIGAEIVGMAYGSALKAGEIKNNQEVMEKAYELGKQLGSKTY